MGGAAKTIGNVVGTGLTLGTNKLGGSDNPLRRFGNFAGSVVTGGQSGQGFGVTRTDANGRPISGISGSGTASDPFVLDPAQSAADQAAITAEGDKQYQQTMTQLPQDVTNAINQSLPGLEETLNSQHLLNGTALPQELARQSSYFTQNLAVPALQNRQSFQTGALQRGLSLEDFTNQANVAKSIGASVAPQVGNGKGTAVSGLGAGASAGTTIMPGYGTAIGAGLGYLAGGGGKQLTSGGSGK